MAVVALPLALAFGIGTGLGAQSGIITAIIAGVLAAAFGGSRFQVSGPTGAMTVILIPIVATYGPTSVLQVGLMASGFLLVAALFRMGSLVRRLPTALIEGFTAGIAIVIALQQVAFLLGVEMTPSDHIWQSVFMEIQSWLQAPRFEAMLVGLIALAMILTIDNRLPKIPIALITIFLLSLITNLLSIDIERIGDLPPLANSFGLEFTAGGNWLALVPAALAVAFLAGLESLLSATIADRLSGSGTHSPNRELFGQAVANFAVPFFGGIPATAALARTAVNIRAGADSRLAAISHGVLLLGFTLLLAPLIASIPLAALAGVLIATAFRMVKFSELRATSRKSPLDAMVLTITLVATVVFDLISALGIGLALYLLLRRSRLATSKIPVDEAETLGD